MPGGNHEATTLMILCNQLETSNGLRCRSRLNCPPFTQRQAPEASL
jgi:hypothetical protein